MHVADWLRSLGLEQYEPAFRENEIDDKVLPRLTAEDLKELGVKVVGHRRRLLDAIIALQGEAAWVDRRSTATTRRHRQKGLHRPRLGAIIATTAAASHPDCRGSHTDWRSAAQWLRVGPIGASSIPSPSSARSFYWRQLRSTGRTVEDWCLTDHAASTRNRANQGLYTQMGYS